MRSIGLLVISTSFENIKHIFKFICTVSLNETDGLNINQVPTECENAKNYLKRKIATHNIEIEEVDERDTDVLIYDLENENDEINAILVFDEIKQIYLYCVESSKVYVNTTGDHDNRQYSPKLAKKLIEFSKLIPCWSTVIVPIFGYD
jgi:ssDNA-specific exonuclease RecJ